MSSSTITLDRRSRLWLAWLADLVTLSKPRIATLVLVVVATSAYVARWGRPEGVRVLWTLAGTVLVAASASALNQAFERRRDGLMQRTARRPLPAGRLSPAQGFAFAVLTLGGGLAILLVAVNLPAAAWALATWFIYVYLYTPLKTRSPANTMVGAVSGALPVLIGWSAVGGTLDMRVDPRGVLLFLILFLWQFPHFMAIAWMYRREYAQAGFRMLTVVDPSGRQAALQAVATSLTLIPVSLVPVLLTASRGLTGHLAFAGLLGVMQWMCAVAFLRNRSERTARRMLRATLLYLPLLLGGLALAAMP